MKAAARGRRAAVLRSGHHPRASGRRKVEGVSRKLDPRALEETFRELGARDPAWSAKAHARGDAILARSVFARSLWDEIAKEGSDRWRKTLGWPAILTRIEKLLRGEGSEEDLSVVLRQASVNTLMSIVSVLDRGEAADGRFGEIASGARWGLFEVDEDGKPLRPLESWQGLVRSMDPSERMAEPPTTAPTQSAASPRRPATGRAPKTSQPTKATTTKRSSRPASADPAKPKKR